MTAWEFTLVLAGHGYLPDDAIEAIYEQVSGEADIEHGPCGRLIRVRRELPGLPLIGAIVIAVGEAESVDELPGVPLEVVEVHQVIPEDDWRLERGSWVVDEEKLRAYREQAEAARDEPTAPEAARPGNTSARVLPVHLNPEEFTELARYAGQLEVPASALARGWILSQLVSKPASG